MTRLILWRHGRTSWNLLGRFQGQLDIELDEVGLAQAEESAHRLAAYEPDVIVSSDLRRAARTAEPLGTLAGKEIHHDSRLRERDFGPWQGLTMAEIQEKFPADAQRWAAGELLLDPDIEPWPAMVDRVSQALREVAERVGDGTGIVVTHGGAAHAGCVGLLKWPAELRYGLGVLGNCRIAELNRTRLGWQLRVHNA